MVSTSDHENFPYQKLDLYIVYEQSYHIILNVYFKIHKSIIFAK